MTITDAKNQILAQVKVYTELAEKLYGIKINPTVCFKLKGRVTGKAWTTKNKLQFNLTALEVEGGWNHLLNNTVPHEVAHLVQYTMPSWPKDRKQNPPHGQYWKKVMRDFGVKANRCHSLAMPKTRSQSQYTYSCRCRTHEVSTTIHNRILKGRTYSCASCKVTLKAGPKVEIKKESPYPYV